MRSQILLFLFFISAFMFISNAQGAICAEAEPFCAGGDALVFPNSHPGIPGASNAAQPGINYSCGTGGAPNNPSDWPYPSWYYLRIDSDGDLNFSISQSQNSDGTGSAFDVDFIAWGPFASENINCGADLSDANKIDCSWLPNTTEFMEITGAQAGDIYIVMITNFSEESGFITLQQTNSSDGSSGSTDCSIVNSIDLCDTEITSLDATISGAVSYAWFRDGVLLPETGPILTNVAVPSALYTADAYDASNVIFSVIEFNVNFFEQPIANVVEDQLACTITNGGFWDFDFLAIEGIILGGQSATDFEITFHNTLIDADTNSTALPSIYTNQVAYQEQTIYVRIENIANPACSDITSFLIDVFDQPTATALTYELCDTLLDGDDTNGFVEFDLSLINSEVLNGQGTSQFTVTYHFDQANADSGTSLLTNLYSNAVVDIDQIVVRVENNDNSDCYDTALINLVVNDLPIIINSLELIQCDADSDGFSDFNLTQANSLISSNVANETFTFYNTMNDANNTIDTITNTSAYTNTNPSSTPDILFVRVENNEGCHRVAQLNLLVEATQIPQTVEILYEACDTGNVDNDLANGITTFDFSDAEIQIRAQSGLPAGQNLTFTYYQAQTDALAELNAIPDISNYRNEMSPFEQEIYVRVDGDLDNACVGLGIHVRLRAINPTLNIDPDDIVLCDDNAVGDLVENFDLTQNEAYIFNGDPDVTASYYFSFADANDAIGEITSPTTYANTNPTETIFARVTNSLTTCYAIVDFDIKVNPLPDASVSLTNFFECENNTDFIFDFSLEDKTTEILNGQSPTEFAVTYYDSQLDADNLTDPLPNIHTNTVNSEQIFVAITNNITGCSISTLSFNLTVVEGADANDDGEVIDYEICDEFGPNDGIAQFDLSIQDAEILDGQNPVEFILTYHDSFDNALNNIAPLPTQFENANNPQIIYARVSNIIRPDICFEITELTLQVNLLPIFDLKERYIICLSSNDTAAIDIPAVIDTGLSDIDYGFQWFLNGTPLNVENSSKITPTEIGFYSVIVTDITTPELTSCDNIEETEVIESELPVLTLALVSEAFTGNNTIEATAVTTSTETTFEYSIDNGPWQDDGVFKDVSAGNHTVIARDKNGCGLVNESILVIDYPLYFTPNGDGRNDTWNIIGIDTQPDTIIRIFDRYGKLLKQLSPTGEGWNGTFNGSMLPTSDYWFTVVYTEPLTGNTKEFKAHFTLKR
jgi:gliding motility-associated-like protein